MDEPDDDGLFEYMGLSQRIKEDSKKKKLQLSLLTQKSKKRRKQAEKSSKSQPSITPERSHFLTTQRGKEEVVDSADDDIIFAGTSARSCSTSSRKIFLSNLEDSPRSPPVPVFSSTPAPPREEKILAQDSAPFLTDDYSSTPTGTFLTAPSRLRQTSNTDTTEDPELHQVPADDSVPEEEMHSPQSSRNWERENLAPLIEDGEEDLDEPLKMSLEYPRSYSPVKIHVDHDSGRLDVEFRRRTKQTSIQDYFGGGRKDRAESGFDSCSNTSSGASGTEDSGSRIPSSDGRRKNGAGTGNSSSGESRLREGERRMLDNGGFHRVSKWNCPAYKRVPGSRYVVDAFAFGYIEGVTGYFLSHFHSDHYQGLNGSFKKEIYCTQVTGNLVMLKLKVDKRYINVLRVGETQTMEDGTTVTLIDANHCPGSVMFLFVTPDGKRHLHSGDMRAEECVLQSPHFQDSPRIDNLFLDTTQKEVIRETVAAVREELRKKPNSLVVCGTYTIGKERILKALAEALKTKIGVKRDKYAVMKCLEDEALNKMLTQDFFSTNLHVVFGEPSNAELENVLSKYSKFDHVIGVWPSGWQFSGKKSWGIAKVSRRGKVTKIGVPYSEHSSFTELKNFVKTLKPKSVIPTVSAKNRKALEEMYFGPWLKDPRSYQTTIRQFSR